MGVTTLSLIILPLTTIAFIFYVVGFACPYWLKKEFVLKGVFPVVVGNNTMLFDLKVDSNIGLLESCDEKTPIIPMLNTTRSETDCGSDGAKDWQKIAAGLSIAGLVLSFLSLSLCTLAVLISKCRSNKKIRISAAVVNVITVGCMLGALILYVNNKEIQVAPPLPIEINYDINWAFFLFVASAALLALNIPLIIVDTLWAQGKSGNITSKEPSVSYQNY